MLSDELFKTNPVEPTLYRIVGVGILIFFSGSKLYQNPDEEAMKRAKNLGARLDKYSFSSKKFQTIYGREWVTSDVDTSVRSAGLSTVGLKILN